MKKWNMKYAWMNEAGSVFAEEGFLVEVPYVEPSFSRVLMSSPWLLGLIAYAWMIWKKLCVICYVLYEDVMCCTHYDIYVMHVTLMA